MSGRASIWTIACRVVLSLLTVATTGSMVWGFMGVLGADGVHALDWPLLGLFTVLTLWVSFSFWAATIGLYARITRSNAVPEPATRPRSDASRLPKTAVLVPIYNEDPAAVFAGITATCRSLIETGHAGRFEVFVLSDTRDANVWAAEQRAWRATAERFAGKIAVWYRRRADNRAKKSGNVGEFCQRWGGRYEFMVVFDADSVMSGATMVEMVRRMEADAQLGILQVPPQPVRGESLLARVQQFASSLYGDVFATGLAQWTGEDGNYWGHNAIIRVAPFIEHCDLPELAGAPPLGGPILSHDFIEAALMRRAGWKVKLATDLRGSYERCPTNLIDFAQRDQRWCQGNLQHANILIRRRLGRVSRVHLLSGIMSYVAAPLLTLFLLVGLAQSTLRNFGAVGQGADYYWWPSVNEPFEVGVGMFVATMLMLLLPKLWAIFTLDTEAQRRIGHGDHGDAVMSTLIETLISVLIAPIMLAYHTRFVVGALIGSHVSWGKQQRTAQGVSLGRAFDAHAAQTLIGIGLMTYTSWAAPELFWWLSPIGIGLVLSMPVSMLLGSVTAGRWARTHGLFLIPEELREPRLLSRAEAAEDELAAFAEAAGEPDTWLLTLLDPLACADHLNAVAIGGAPADRHAAAPPEPPADLEAARSMPAADRIAVLRHPDAVLRWRRWLWSTLSADQLDECISRNQSTRPVTAAR